MLRKDLALKYFFNSDKSSNKLDFSPYFTIIMDLLLSSGGTLVLRYEIEWFRISSN